MLINARHTQVPATPKRRLAARAQLLLEGVVPSAAVRGVRGGEGEPRGAAEAVCGLRGGVVLREEAPAGGLEAAPARTQDNSATHWKKSTRNRRYSAEMCF